MHPKPDPVELELLKGAIGEDEPQAGDSYEELAGAIEGGIDSIKLSRGDPDKKPAQRQPHGARTKRKDKRKAARKARRKNRR